MNWFEVYYAYLDWCNRDNWANMRDPNHDYMEWNHTLPRCLFKGHGPGQWLTIEQHAIASALQTLVFGTQCHCGWHKKHVPKVLWKLCESSILNKRQATASKTGSLTGKSNFTNEGRRKGIESQRKNKQNFFDPDFHKFENQSAAGKLGGKKTYELGVGIFGMSEEKNFRNRSSAGKVGGYSGLNSDPDYLSERGKKGGKEAHKEKDEDGKSIFAKEIARKSHERKNEEGKSEHAVSIGSKGGSVSGKQVWESTKDGFRSNAPTVARHNKSRGWDPNDRIRIS